MRSFGSFLELYLGLFLFVYDNARALDSRLYDPRSSSICFHLGSLEFESVLQNNHWDVIWCNQTVFHEVSISGNKLIGPIRLFSIIRTIGG